MSTQNQPRKKKEPSGPQNIDNLEFYSRNWHGGAGTHTFKNKVSGAFGIMAGRLLSMKRPVCITPVFLCGESDSPLGNPVE